MLWLPGFVVISSWAVEGERYILWKCLESAKDGNNEAATHERPGWSPQNACAITLVWPALLASRDRSSASPASSLGLSWAVSCLCVGYMLYSSPPLIVTAVCVLPSRLAISNSSYQQRRSGLQSALETTTLSFSYLA